MASVFIVKPVERSSGKSMNMTILTGNQGKSGHTKSETTEKEVSLATALDRQMDNLVGVFTDAIIVMPGGWEDTLPDWIKGEITLERLVENMAVLAGEKPTASDAEACAYLYTASLTRPMGSQWTQIYLYVAGKVISRRQGGTEMPQDIKVDSLSDYDMNSLHHLKGWIYDQRIKHRQEKKRAEKRQAMAEVKAKAPKQLGLLEGALASALI